MSILDRYNVFTGASGQSPTSTGATASTDIIDLQAAGDAVGDELFFVVKATVQADSAADGASVAFSLQTAADGDAAFSSPTTLFSTAAIAEATLAPGYTVCRVRIPQGCLRYLRAVFTISGEALTAGTFEAYLTRDIQTNDFQS